MLANQFLQNTLRLLNVIVVANPKGHIDSTGTGRGGVGDDPAPNVVIGDNHRLVVKRPDAEELLGIRNGSMTYEEVVAYAEKMDKEVREVWYKKTGLRKKPDLKFAASLLMEVQDMVWSNE